MSSESRDGTGTLEETSSDTTASEPMKQAPEDNLQNGKSESEQDSYNPEQESDKKKDVNETVDVDAGSIYRKFDSEEAGKLEEPSETEGSEEGPPEKKQIEALEIGMDESFDEENADMEGLLDGNSRKKKKKKEVSSIQRRKVGNMYIFLPSVFARYGWGIAGPHWFGPFCVLFLILLASHYFIKISLTRIGPITAAICVIFTFACIYHLVNCSYRDPGVVKLQPGSNQPQQSVEDQRLQYRWCDLCQCFQPPDGAHCSDCNACMAGFDHHCVWMGTCIGRKNYKQFVLFNVTWLLYLIYAIIWVSVAGPLIFSHHRKH